MSVLRISFMKRFIKNGIYGKLINTIHDSIVVDCESREVDRVVQLFKETFKDLPRNIERTFGIKFPLEVRCEIEVGLNQKEMEKV